MAAQIFYLQVFHRVPVMFYKYNCISTSEIQPQASNMSGEKQDIDRWIVVKSGGEINGIDQSLQHCKVK